MVFRPRFILAITAAATLLPSFPATAVSCRVQFSNDESSDFRSKMDDFFAGHPGGKHLSGVLKIVGPGKDYERTFNKADDQTGKANDFDTSFLIASTSKQFAAAGILKLEEAGKLRIDDPISKYFPEIPVDRLTSLQGNQVRIWNLLTHTSGMYDVSEDEGYSNSVLRTPIKAADIIKILKGQYLNADPGSVFNYTDTNYDLISEIIHRVSKKSYSKFMTDTFFKPLKMTGTHAGYDSSLLPHLARSYKTNTRRAGSTRKDYFKDEKQQVELVGDVFAAGNIFSTANDLTTWLQGLLNGRILSDDSRQKMWSTTDASNYGFGWSIQQNDYRSVVYQHNGGWAGYSALIAISPSDGTTLVWLSNAPVDDQDGNDFRNMLLEMTWERNN